MKPFVSGSYQKKSWANWNYDTPLFSEWTVSWDETAGCGHESCGIEWVTEKFVTWQAAIDFALKLKV